MTEHERPEEGRPEEGGLEVIGLGHQHRRPRRPLRRLVGCLLPLALLVALAGAAYVGLTRGVDELRDLFADPADYPGPGNGSVTIEVEQGDTATDIARDLEEEGVIASVEAFVAAANARAEESAGIQVGFYELREEMRADDALSVLVDPANLIQSAVTIPEGLRVVDIVEILARNTDFAKKRFTSELARPGRLGLPAYANGNPEGYLFPATYTFKPADTPRSMLRAMVSRWRQAAEGAGLEEAAGRLGYTPAELMTVASLVEAEGRGDDMPKIARVIYNRLEGDETNGLLQIDAAVNYAHDRDLGVALTNEDLRIDSPYNTYRNPGLPPTPIEAPGDDAIAAALNPAEGDWYYYVTVDLRTGETKFAEDYDTFLEYKAEFRRYCETSEAC